MFGENGSKDMAMRYHAADKTWQTDGVTYVVYAGAETKFWVGWGAKDFGVREASENFLASNPKLVNRWDATGFSTNKEKGNWRIFEAKSALRWGANDCYRGALLWDRR